MFGWFCLLCRSYSSIGDGEGGGGEGGGDCGGGDSGGGNEYGER